MLETENIPFLQKLLNLPVGGNTPFTAEVWFVNMSVEKLDMGWGGNFIVRDPMYVVPVKLYANGQYGFKINDGETFIKKIVGTIHDVSADEISSKFCFSAGYLLFPKNICSTFPMWRSVIK